MNFLSNVANSIPGVGHVKGFVHYAVGDTDGGNEAMYQSTRTSAVLAGGAAGAILGGPAGAAAGGMYAGLGYDSLASAATNKPQGIVQSCESIAKDLKSGKNPSGSVLHLGLDLGLDAVGGFGMSSVSGTIGNASKKAVASSGKEVILKSASISTKEIAKMTTKKVAAKTAEQVVERTTLISLHVVGNAAKETEKEEKAERQKREKEKRKERANEKEKAEREKCEKEKKEERANEQAGSGGTGSGSSQPPQRNNDNNKKSEDFESYMELLKELLKLIYGDQEESFSIIFQNLSEAQEEYLVKIIMKLKKFGTVYKAVVKLVIKIFKEHFTKDLSFTNFLSLLEFVLTYILDELNQRIMISRGTQQTTRPKMTYRERREKIIGDIMSQKDIVQQLVDEFERLKAEIEAETLQPNNILSPNFRDIFSAVYHYIKHRCVPGDGILSVKEYYGYIKILLGKLKQTPEYASLTRSREPSSCIYEIYMVIFGRRFRIIVHFFHGQIKLTSAYVVKTESPEDEDEDIFIKIEKL